MYALPADQKNNRCKDKLPLDIKKCTLQICFSPLGDKYQ